MRKFAFAIATALLFAAVCHAQSEKPLLLRQPTMSKTQIAFAYGGDIWTVNREGGEATRLTSGPGSKSNPRNSPPPSNSSAASYTQNTPTSSTPSTQHDPPARARSRPAGPSYGMNAAFMSLERRGATFTPYGLVWVVPEWRKSE